MPSAREKKEVAACLYGSLGEGYSSPKKLEARDERNPLMYKGIPSPPMYEFAYELERSISCEETVERRFEKGEWQKAEVFVSRGRDGRIMRARGWRAVSLQKD